MKVNNGLLRCLFLFTTVFMARCSTKTGVDVDDELPANEFNLGKAREEALKLSNLIYQRYEFWNEKTYPFFLYSSNMPDYAWDILKYKIAIKTLMKPKTESPLLKIDRVMITAMRSTAVKCNGFLVGRQQPHLKMASPPPWSGI